MRFGFTDRALAQIDAIEAYLTERNPPAARRTIDRIIGMAEVLADHPFMGRDYDGVNRVFSVPRTRYRIFYRVREEKDVVEVLTVAHSRNLPPSLDGQLSQTFTSLIDALLLKERSLVEKLRPH